MDGATVPRKVPRRTFLKGAAAAGAAAAGGALAPPAPVTGQAGIDAPARVSTAPGRGPRVIERPGSDFLVDVLKALEIEYIAANPGSSFRGLQESIVNYGGNTQPEFLTCCHEESSVAIAHGYAKAASRPMGILAHSTVGLQHAAMAVYNAWCDRVPVLLLAGNLLDATKRRPGVEWAHCAQDPAVILRDYLKWDDQPTSLQACAESLVRAYKIATTPPMAPVLVVLDAELQEAPIADEAALRIPRLTPAVPPQGDAGAVREAARLLVEAESPVILADRAVRTSEGIRRLVELAEALHAPVVDLGARMNFPTDHYLNLSEMRGRLIRQADVILALEVWDLWGQLHTVTDPYHEERRVARPDARVISISVGELYLKSNYQDFQRFTPVDLSITGDVEATLPALTEAVRSIAGGRLTLLSQRGDQLRSLHEDMKRQGRREATYGWNASPVSTARVAAEVWALIKDEDWSLVAGNFSGWARRLWKLSEPYHMLGHSGGFGVGYTAPAAVGAALANRRFGRLSIAHQPDGDLLYAPGVLWTAAHHRIPVLYVMFNNRAYHQETMHLQRMASLRNRRPDQAHIGTAITDPDVDFAKLAQSMGVWAEGPISDPDAVGPALRRALEVVKSGYPALVDIVSQPR
ncbi:MAG TPA: thiamine pyrophosphate-dependent enzyme [Chloroflexota bacterium]|nr:thiamine pyrophosphate-dependent enzyme [Chloroflexota bacterium]